MIHCHCIFARGIPLLRWKQNDTLYTCVHGSLQKSDSLLSNLVFSFAQCGSFKTAILLQNQVAILSWSCLLQAVLL